MSYTPTFWQAHDKVTAAKLNKIEEGIAKAEIFLVYHGVTISGEIDSAITEGRLPVVVRDITTTGGRTIRYYPLVFYGNTEVGKTYTFSNMDQTWLQYVNLDVKLPQGTETWGSFYNVELVPTNRSINNKGLTHNITLTAGDIEFSDDYQYTEDTVGGQIERIKKSLVFLAKPVYNAGAIITGYTFNREMDDIIDAADTGVVQCFILRGGEYIPTLVEQIQDGISVCPIDHNAETNLTSFNIVLVNNQYQVNLTNLPTYLLLSAQNEATMYVPMCHYGGAVYFEPVNVDIQFGDSLTPIIDGAINYLTQTGSDTVTLATSFTNAEEIQALCGISALCVDAMINDRGVIARAVYYNDYISLNILSASEKNGVKKVFMSINLCTHSVTSGALSAADILSGTVSIETGLDSDGYPEYAISHIHLNKYSAVVV